MNALRRKTDQPAETSEQRQARWMAGLAREVGIACSEWLLSRGINPPRFNYDALQGTPDAKDGTPADDDTPGGHSKSLDPSHRLPNGVKNFYEPRISKKRGMPI